MSTLTFQIPSDAGPGAAPPNPGTGLPVSDVGLFALLMSEAQGDGGGSPGVSPRLPADEESLLEVTGEAADPTSEVGGGPASSRPPDSGMLLDDSSGLAQNWTSTLHPGKGVVDVAAAPLSEEGGAAGFRNARSQADLEKNPIDSTADLPEFDAFEAGPDPDADTIDFSRLSDQPDESTASSARLETRSLSEIDFDAFDVKRIELQVEHSNRRLPEPEANGILRPNSDEAPSLRRADGADRTIADAVSRDASRQAVDPNGMFHRPDDGPIEPDVVRETGYVDEFGDPATPELSEEPVTSEPEWNAPGSARSRSHQPPDTQPEVSHDTSPDASLDGPDLQDPSRPAGEVRSDLRDSAAGVGDRRVLLPQPPKPADLPTYASEPARRVMMTVGDTEDGVHVMVHENNGDVTIRFDAPQALRAHLETSAHQLFEAMSREQVSLTNMTFAGSSHGDDGSPRPRYVPDTGRNKTAVGESADAPTTTDSGLTFSGTGARIQIRV